MFKYADCTNYLDSLLPFIATGHHSWKVLLTASSVCTELMNVSFYWFANIHVFIYRNLLKNVAYGFILISPAMSCMSHSSYFDG